MGNFACTSPTVPVQQAIKDRLARIETLNGLLAELERYLNGIRQARRVQLPAGMEIAPMQADEGAHPLESATDRPTCLAA